MMDGAFWKGRRVFLTGHTGMKGGWLSLWLQALGAEVHGYALGPPSEPNLFTVARVGDGMAASRIADIRDADALAAAVKKSRAEVVIHLAAQALVRDSYADPIGTYASNVMGTLHLLEAVRRAETVRAAICVTSDKCYENREWPWGYREIDPMGGYDPYSSSKGCAELVVASYRNSFLNPADFDRHGVAVASVRAGNIIGGGDWARDRLVPDIVRAILAGKPAHIRYPGAIRPWQHVFDPLAGYLVLAQRLVTDGPAVAEAWNFGPDVANEVAVSQVADAIVARWGGDARWQHDGGDHPHEAGYLKLDCSKARSRLGWRPTIDLGAAIGMTVDWYRAHAERKDMRDVTLGQISTHAFAPAVTRTTA